MALDRYVAISKPLHYVTMMSKGRCTGLIVASWVGGFVHSIVQISLLVPLPFCGPNVLDTFYCGVPQDLKLACTDIVMLELLTISNIMAFDRYIAISKPLHYVTTMSRGRCSALIVASWVGGLIHSIVQISLLLPLPFCGPNVLDTFY
ncbi:hypothetical protein HPG69_018997, partial [Diceros bicornis minor]